MVLELSSRAAYTVVPLASETPVNVNELPAPSVNEAVTLPLAEPRTVAPASWAVRTDAAARPVENVALRPVGDPTATVDVILVPAGTTVVPGSVKLAV
jgi:hypothetical protein